MEDRPPTDGELVYRTQSGDRTAFDLLVHRHHHIAFRVAFIVCRSASEAEEAAQEAFVRAYRAIGRFRDGAEFRPWLLRIVGNAARNRKRASGRRLHYEMVAARQVVSGDAVPSPEMTVEAAETRRTLLEAVNRLPEPERLVVALRYFGELTEKETSQVARVPRGTVKSRISRAMTRLRADLGEIDDV